MRQILLNNSGAVVARVPRPAIGPGRVLVRVDYSLISVGTELAPLKASLVEAPPDASAAQRGAAYADLAARYLRASWRDPEKAARRLASIGRQYLARLRPAPAPVLSPVLGLGELTWTRAAAAELDATGARLEIVTDASQGSYQAMSQPVPVGAGTVAVVRINGTLHEGAISIGVLSESKDRWLGSRTFEAGRIEDDLMVDPGESRAVTVVISTAGAGRSRVTLDAVDVTTAAASPGGLPANELDAQGWGVGYSAAGEVVEVGEGVTDLVPGNRVACAGAGQANHADWISVPRNLVCRVPDNVSLSAAASATVGAIAMQGLRRTAPELGERIAVIGLGLIGQLTTQLFQASGCVVIGLDLDESRVSRATALGMDAGAGDPDAFRAAVRDLTGGHGADRTVLTAATRSDAVINLAMDVTRAKGRVVIVGDVGLNVQRAAFYRKEIDLVMSTSYGPGRYDPAYEVEGRDYPYAYVRWTLNRNMQSYLELVGAGRVNVDALIDRVIRVDEAPAAYRTLAEEGGKAPLGVLIRYPDDPRDLPEPADATRITIRGHRLARQGVVNYALVGASAFGMSMLVPQMKRCRDRFALRGVVSRNNPQASNFARDHGVETLASRLEDVVDDPSFDLMVIATRHSEHADQVVRSLEAGKHVFVEKPLAITWDELDRVATTYGGLEEKPVLMVGFNRRFSPALRQLSALLAGRRSALVINYRLNGGFIPLDSWVQGRQGGGRNIGEACHMYDVFRYLAGAPVTAVNATAIDPGSLPYLRNDNFSATISYGDGTVATLVYTALGPKTGLGKERIEVFCDGEAYLIDDFKNLIKTSDGTVLWQSAEVDKGHFEEISRLGDAIAGGEPPIPVDDIFETTAVSLHVEDLLQRR
jgi:predicted dehydrogenase/threonine dehydrogenase-like Zn-dependent dehydrogenase